jgi:hypothetical protein
MTTTKHYSEADLLETYYMQPGQSMPVMMHLANCSDCAARYDRLDRKLREASSCPTEKHETFWARQRHTIMRSIGARRERSAVAVRAWRFVAAALLAFLLGGAVVYESLAPARPAVAPTDTIARNAPKNPLPAPPAATVPANEDLLLHDAWQSEDLREFHGVVQWESWTDTKPVKGDGSL